VGALLSFPQVNAYVYRLTGFFLLAVCLDKRKQAEGMLQESIGVGISQQHNNFYKDV